MAATLVDIAKETHTSVSTVSRVLSGGVVANRISKETRDRIQEAAQRLGYRPNLIARTLRTRRSNTVALLVSDIANPFFAQIGSLIEQALHRHGYSLMLCNSSEDPQREVEHLTLLNQRGIDGLILVPVTRSREHIAAHLNPDLPLVILDRPVPGASHTVATDQELAGKMLCDAVAAEGIEQVAMVSGLAHVATHRRRCELVAERFDLIARYEGPATRGTGRLALESFVACRPQAIMCSNSALAIGLLEALADRNIEFPGDDFQPIIGVFDELPMVDLLPVPILCSTQDTGALADSCVAQLLPQLTGDHTPREAIILSPRILANRAFRAWQRRGEAVAN